MVCDRYNLSDREGAAIATAALKAYEIVGGSNTENVINRIKLRGERRKCRKEMRKKDKDF